jgi:hypothetical protein
MILGFRILTSQLLQSKWENSLVAMFLGLYIIFISYNASRYVMSPPIREAGHGKALQAALSSGILQVTHLCHTLNCGVKQIAYCLSAFLH